MGMGSAKFQCEILGNYCEFVNLRKHGSVVISAQSIVNNSMEYQYRSSGSEALFMDVHEIAEKSCLYISNLSNKISFTHTQP